ncbi:uncharacterized protein LOC117640023 [Thrips palmi]|uniref:Uncharacterized protein LOC117640023 n=1 Tax=Thrips palmi TaxID=161013 RepID=A0A6P8YE43_THRPL|nr:uncharacterized protein LOC117640023 [Thrips palmi]XP_034232098.1 uncharacterized protein LOC117640023 [Thrips palmi]
MRVFLCFSLVLSAVVAHPVNQSTKRPDDGLLEQKEIVCPPSDTDASEQLYLHRVFGTLRNDATFREKLVQTDIQSSEIAYDLKSASPDIQTRLHEGKRMEMERLGRNCTFGTKHIDCAHPDSFKEEDLKKTLSVTIKYFAVQFLGTPNPKTFFHLHDRNGNGVLEFEEVKAMIKAQLTFLRKCSRDSKTDLDEASAAALKDRLERVFQDGDTNKDGLTTYEEFQRIFMTGVLTWFDFLAVIDEVIKQTLDGLARGLKQVVEVLRH